MEVKEPIMIIYDSWKVLHILEDKTIEYEGHKISRIDCICENPFGSSFAEFCRIHLLDGEYVSNRRYKEIGYKPEYGFLNDKYSTEIIPTYKSMVSWAC